APRRSALGRRARAHARPALPARDRDRAARCRRRAHGARTARGRASDRALDVRSLLSGPAIEAERSRTADSLRALSEEVLARLVVHLRNAQVLADREPGLHRLALLELAEPALEVREVGELLTLVLPRHDPREDHDVGD